MTFFDEIPRLRASGPTSLFNKKHTTMMKSILLPAALAASMAMSASASVVIYSNTNNPLGLNLSAGNIGGTSAELGDEVVMSLVPTAPLESFQFNFWASGFTGNPQIQARVRFYDNDGVPPIGAANPPGTGFFDSGLFPVTIQTAGGGAVVPGDVTYYNVLFTTDVAALTVPQDFTWSVQFFDLGSGEAGVPLYSPPTVGNNYTDYWYRDTTAIFPTWLLLGGAQTNWDFHAQFVMVPEPASVVMMSVIAVVGGLVAWRQRAKAKAIA